MINLQMTRHGAIGTGLNSLLNLLPHSEKKSGDEIIIDAYAGCD